MLDVRCQMPEAKSGQVTLGHRYSTARVSKRRTHRSAACLRARYCTDLAWLDLKPFRNGYAARRRGAFGVRRALILLANSENGTVQGAVATWWTRKSLPTKRQVATAPCTVPIRQQYQPSPFCVVRKLKRRGLRALQTLRAPEHATGTRCKQE